MQESALARKAQLIQQELLAQLEDTRNKLQELQAVGVWSGMGCVVEAA